MKRRDLLALMLLAPAAAAYPQEGRRDPFAGDSRLQRKVRVHAEGIALGELLPLVSRKCQVQLTVSRDLADEKILHFGPERPLGVVLADLAALFNARWTRTGGPEAAYELAQSLPQRQLEARLLRSVTERMMAQLEEQVRALGETPEQLRQRPPTDRVRRLFSSDEPGHLLGTQIYALLGPQHRERLFAAGSLRIGFQEFTPAQQATLRNVYEGFIEKDRQRNEEVMREDPNSRVHVTTQEELESLGVVVYVQRQGGRASAYVRVGNTGHLQLGYLDGGDQLLPRHGNPYTAEEVSPDGLPGAEQSSMAARERTWIDQLRKLAELTGITIAADYYRVRPVHEPRPLPSSPEALKDPVLALDTLCSRSGALWWNAGQTLFVRKRDFFIQRLYEPPDRWLAAGSEALRARSGAVQLQDLLRLRDLTPRQVAGLRNLVRVHPVDERFNRDLHPMLALLATLGRPGSTPIYPEDLAQKIDGAREQQASFVFKTRSAGQQRLLQELEAVQDHPFGAELRHGDLRIKAYCLPTPQETESGYRYVTAWLQWNLHVQLTPQRGLGQGGLLQEVYLPLSLPEDRRERTRVEVQP